MRVGGWRTRAVDEVALWALILILLRIALELEVERNRLVQTLLLLLPSLQGLRRE